MPDIMITVDKFIEDDYNHRLGIGECTAWIASFHHFEPKTRNVIDSHGMDIIEIVGVYPVQTKEHHGHEYAFIRSDGRPPIYSTDTRRILIQPAQKANGNV